jgi:hypothetical protein
VIEVHRRSICHAARLRSSDFRTWT